MPELHHLSRDAHDRLKAELDDLTTRGRVDIARKIEAARELGDLSENGDYQAAKEEQGKMEGRIRHLTAMLRDVEIVEGASTDQVEAGSVVELRYEGEDDTERYLVGSIEERRGDVQVVSPGSPARLRPARLPAGRHRRVRGPHRRAAGRGRLHRGLSRPSAPLGVRPRRRRLRRPLEPGSTAAG